MDPEVASQLWNERSGGMGLSLCRWASVLMGITNTAATLPGFIAPAMVSAIASSKDVPTLRHQWRTVFAIAAGVHVVGAALYSVMASGEKQPWADDDWDSEVKRRSGRDDADGDRGAAAPRGVADGGGGHGSGGGRGSGGGTDSRTFAGYSVNEVR